MLYVESMAGTFTVSASPITELEIKVSIIARLKRAGHLEGGVVVNEFPVESSTRRVDLAVANGKLTAFEVKSDLDSLRRLNGQVSTFLRYFDKTTVVVTDRFVDRALEELPKNVAVWRARRTADDMVSVAILRRGHTLIVSERDVLVRLLRKSEIVALLRACGEHVDVSQSKGELTHRVMGIPAPRVRRHVIACIKKRYAASQVAPLNPRTSRQGTPASTVIDRSSQCCGSRQKVDVASFVKQFGPLPPGTPSWILRPSPGKA